MCMKKRRCLIILKSKERTFLMAMIIGEKESNKKYIRVGWSRLMMMTESRVKVNVTSVGRSTKRRRCFWVERKMMFWLQWPRDRFFKGNKAQRRVLSVFFPWINSRSQTKMWRETDEGDWFLTSFFSTRNSLVSRVPHSLKWIYNSIDNRTVSHTLQVKWSSVSNCLLNFLSELAVLSLTVREDSQRTEKREVCVSLCVSLCDSLLSCQSPASLVHSLSCLSLLTALWSNCPRPGGGGRYYAGRLFSSRKELFLFLSPVKNSVNKGTKKENKFVSEIKSIHRKPNCFFLLHF